MSDLRQDIIAIAHKFLRKVSPSGPTNVMALCPFHDDNTPSFAMNTETGVFICHGCHAKGTLYTFLRDVGVDRATMQLEYKDILQQARDATPFQRDHTEPKLFDSEPIPEYLLGYFDGYRIDSLLQEGFEERTLKHFDVGYDSVHARITYPIRDIKGSLVAISGRAVYDSMSARYKVYNTEYEKFGLPKRGYFDKSRHMYNAHNVYPSTVLHNQGSHGGVILVEGFKACMWVWQMGFKDVMALMGSFLTWEHIWVLCDLGAPIYLFLDNNDAGLSGTVSSIKSLIENGTTLPLFVVEYPDRLKDEVKAQPDRLTQQELVEQVHNATVATTWLRKVRTWGIAPQLRAERH